MFGFYDFEDFNESEVRRFTNRSKYLGRYEPGQFQEPFIHMATPIVYREYKEIENLNGAIMRVRDVIEVYSEKLKRNIRLRVESLTESANGKYIHITAVGYFTNEKTGRQNTITFKDKFNINSLRSVK